MQCRLFCLISSIDTTWNQTLSLLSCVCVCVCLVTQSCMTIYHPMDCSPPGSSVHAILQSRILEWASISFSRGSSLPRNQTWVSKSPALMGGFLTSVPPGKPSLQLPPILIVCFHTSFCFRVHPYHPISLFHFWLLNVTNLEPLCISRK